ncbi:MAG TPA: polysaccharide deacetylase family protein [Gemmataceae bacterium]|nr:polysaccharide deacetylase family protein [Gemmataceae bacterium]
MSIERIAVFSGNLSYSVRKNIIVIDRALPGLTWLILLHSPKKTLGQTWRGQWRNLRRHGWRRISALASVVRKRLAARALRPAAAQSPGGEYTTAALKARPNVRILEVPDIHAPEVLEEIRAFDPNLGLSLAAPILRHDLFAIPRLGTVNLHKGKVPEYRGMPPAFWEMWNDEESVGCTVHWVEQKLDTGPIASATSITRERYSTVRGLQLRLDEVGIDLMRDVVVEIARGSPRRSPQAPGGKTYRQPTLAQEAQLARKIARQSPTEAPLPKRLLKNAIKGTAFAAGIGCLHRVAVPRANVLLYHRVTDSVRDNLTTGIEQFDRQMALLRRHFRIISLAELLDKDAVPKTDRPLVCVTFDDGYLDNYLNAAPILLRHEISAAFFVSTGIVGTERRFPHDIRRGNPSIPLMQWDHLRKLHENGFLIGSHTVNHIDCAAEPEEVVRAELEQSRDHLYQELSLQRVIFSYPYGGRQHMTAERLALVKRAGYIGCVSAYGGSNVGKIDRFNVLRRGIHWEFSDASFLYESLGLW